MRWYEAISEVTTSHRIHFRSGRRSGYADQSKARRDDTDWMREMTDKLRRRTSKKELRRVYSMTLGEKVEMGPNCIRRTSIFCCEMKVEIYEVPIPLESGII